MEAAKKRVSIFGPGVLNIGDDAVVLLLFVDRARTVFTVFLPWYPLSLECGPCIRVNGSKEIEPTLIESVKCLFLF